MNYSRSPSPYVDVIHELLDPLGFKSHDLYHALDNQYWSIVVIDDFVITRRKDDKWEKSFKKFDLNNPKSLDELVKMVTNV